MSVTYFTPPVTCPECGTVLTRDGEYLVCRGESCPAQKAGAVKNWISKLGILNFGDSFVEALIDAGFVEDAADLYTLDVNEIEDVEIGGRRAGATAKKAMSNLKAKMALPLHVFIGSLGIPMIDKTMAKLVIDAGYDTLAKLYNVKISDVERIPGMGSKKAETFVTGLREKMRLISRLIGVAGITIQDNSGPLKGMSFCFTGFRDSSMEAAIEKAGGTMKNSVSKTLTYLVCNDPNVSTGKAAKAKEYGTKVISPDDVWTMV
jgi:DNA ligase (NAD+)